MKKYIRLNIIAEGQTEMEFAKNTLSVHFEPFGIMVDSRCVITSKTKHRDYRGGLLDYSRAKKDIINWIKEDRGDKPFFTTMFDLYSLPNDFPKFDASLKINDPYERMDFLENAMAENIDYFKFIPYLQLHEFEALLLANPDALLLEYTEAKNEIEELKKIVKSYDNNPEKVNTGKETAPSKQIISLIPKYYKNKVTVGASLAGYEGIDIQKKRCKHFSDWIDKIIEKVQP